MAYKRLSVDEITEMKKMVQQGVAPEDLSQHFGIAISSVHNYKKQFKKGGLQFPDVRGKRPHKQAFTPSGVVNHNGNTPIPQNGNVNNVGGNYKFVVNGMTLEIDQHAKSVNIGNGVIKIDF